MQFKTKSGSVYELDMNNKMARAITQSKPHPSVRLTGQWRPFLDVEVEVGKSAWIYWTVATPPLPGTEEPSMPATVTSEVVEIIP